MKITERDILPEDLSEPEAREIYSDVKQSPGRREEAGVILGYWLPTIIFHEKVAIPIKRVVKYVKSCYDKVA